MRFFNFLNFFAILFGIFLPGSSGNGIRDYNFFLTFSANLILVWIQIMPEWCFLIFWIFLLFFLEFSSPGRGGTEFGTKIFFSFSAYLIPVWIEITPVWCFLIFWIYLLFFMEFSSPDWVWTEFRTNFFFLYFSPYLMALG